MYHDQGQIAIKLLGFSRGVTVQGGLPVPITTPAHGTAYDIAGRGTADVGATWQALQIACRMGAARHCPFPPDPTAPPADRFNTTTSHRTPETPDEDPIRARPRLPVERQDRAAPGQLLLERDGPAVRAAKR